MEPVALHVPPAAVAEMLRSSETATATAAARRDLEPSPLVAIEIPLQQTRTVAEPVET